MELFPKYTLKSTGLNGLPKYNLKSTGENGTFFKIYLKTA